jgi:DNA-binding transcriptional LysR family regulator
MNRASQELFISQSCLSGAIKELENEIGFSVFNRSNRGIAVTPDGKEFLGYAKQIMEQYQLIESRYVNKQIVKNKFSVSAQHYCFAVNSFMRMIRKLDIDDYEFTIHETKTYAVVEDVKSGYSEIGIIYLDEFNQKVIEKLLGESDLVFHELFQCGIYAYLWSKNPLASKSEITLEELSEYPFLSFDQGKNNSLHFAEEGLGTYEYKKVIKVNDRASMLNLMVGLNGFTLCTGLICEDLYGMEYKAIPLKSKTTKRIGYIVRKNTALTSAGELYINELNKIKNRLV